MRNAECALSLCVAVSSYNLSRGSVGAQLASIIIGPAVASCLDAFSRATFSVADLDIFSSVLAITALYRPWQPRATQDLP